MSHTDHPGRRAMSRAGLLGAGGAAGAALPAPPAEMWYDMDSFCIDQVSEVMEKLRDSALDDEIWGKIVIMEKCKRVAKAYLRRTTVIVDGGAEEFDGRTLGFCHFSNPARDATTAETRGKIDDGVVLRMDNQGNIKALARGSAPVYCMGWRDRSAVMCDRLLRQQGRMAEGGTGGEEKPYRVFDMRRFKQSLEREAAAQRPDCRRLLIETVVRIALVKDSADLSRTPCWFAIVNLVALDMLLAAIPNLAEQDLSPRKRQPVTIHTTHSQPSIGVASPGREVNPALSQLIAAAVNQCGGNGHSIDANQLAAQIASSLGPLSPGGGSERGGAKEEKAVTSIAVGEQRSGAGKKDWRRCPADDSMSSDEDSALPVSDSSTRGGAVGAARAKRRDPSSPESSDFSSIDRRPLAADRRRGERPALRAELFETRVKDKGRDTLGKNSCSTTSDYESNKEHFDSGSWSSSGSTYEQFKGRCNAKSSAGDVAEKAVEKTEERQIRKPPVDMPLIRPVAGRIEKLERERERDALRRSEKDREQRLERRPGVGTQRGQLASQITSVACYGGAVLSPRTPRSPFTRPLASPVYATAGDAYVHQWDPRPMTHQPQYLQRPATRLVRSQTALSHHHLEAMRAQSQQQTRTYHKNPPVMRAASQLEKRPAPPPPQQEASFAALCSGGVTARGTFVQSDRLPAPLPPQKTVQQHQSRFPWPSHWRGGQSSMY